MANPQRERPGDFKLVLRAGPGGPPAVIKLRRGLKVLWRACGLRCISAQEVPEQPAAGVVGADQDAVGQGQEAPPAASRPGRASGCRGRFGGGRGKEVATWRDRKPDLSRFSKLRRPRAGW
jgi:hypothetical protein